MCWCALGSLIVSMLILLPAKVNFRRLALEEDSEDNKSSDISETSPHLPIHPTETQTLDEPLTFRMLQAAVITEISKQLFSL